MPDPNIELLPKETLIQAIKNSVDSTLFNSLMVRLRDTGEIKDILNNGEYSCAFFVSSLLYITDLINKPRATVKSTVTYLNKNADTISLEEAEEGDIVVWEKMEFPDGSTHAHIGFLLNSEEAVSTNFRIKKVERHNVHDHGRKVETVFRLKQ